MLLFILTIKANPPGGYVAAVKRPHDLLRHHSVGMYNFPQRPNDAGFSGPRRQPPQVLGRQLPQARILKPPLSASAGPSHNVAQSVGSNADWFIRRFVSDDGATRKKI